MGPPEITSAFLRMCGVVMTGTIISSVVSAPRRPPLLAGAALRPTRLTGTEALESPPPPLVPPPIPTLPSPPGPSVPLPPPFLVAPELPPGDPGFSPTGDSEKVPHLFPAGTEILDTGPEGSSPT